MLEVKGEAIKNQIPFSKGFVLIEGFLRHPDPQYCFILHLTFDGLKAERRHTWSSKHTAMAAYVPARVKILYYPTFLPIFFLV